MTEGLLTRYPLFRLLSPQQRQEWLAESQEIACDSGETLFQENTLGAWVHFVLEGRVRVLRQHGQRELSLGTLLPGDAFGEYALLPPGNNTATCRTIAPSRLLVLPFGPLQAAIEEMPDVQRNLKNWLRLHTLLNFYRERAFLGFMSVESGLKLDNRLTTVSFPAGNTIQARGLAEDKWYLIEQGTVGLREDRMSEKYVAKLGPGETFGEHALLNSDDLPEATALSAVRCKVLARSAFDPFAPIRSNAAQSYEPMLPDRPTTHVWVPQREKSDCGLAALAMVALRRGIKVSVEELRRKARLDRGGLSIQQLRQLAEEIGLSSLSVRVSVDRIGQLHLPAIAHLNNGHYVVLHELVASGAVVGDPATGIVTWNRETVTRAFSGVILLFDKSPECVVPQRFQSAIS